MSINKIKEILKSKGCNHYVQREMSIFIALNKVNMSSQELGINIGYDKAYILKKLNQETISQMIIYNPNNAKIIEEATLEYFNFLNK